MFLYGEPGTGKTLLAKAVANSTSATFLRVVGSELIQKYLGDGPKLVRELFRVADEQAPSIVFIGGWVAWLGGLVAGWVALVGVLLFRGRWALGRSARGQQLGSGAGNCAVWTDTDKALSPLLLPLTTSVCHAALPSPCPCPCPCPPADEIDAVGTKRYDAHSGGEREIQRTMLELLNQLDGFDAMTDVKVGGGLAVGGLACR